jgi:hypothetical protein
MKNAFIITAAVLLGLIGIVLAAGKHWPGPETPPRQGEALDTVALERGVIIHSQRSLSHVIREPQNTWSNLAFVMVGAHIVSRGFSRRAKMVGVTLIAVGIGSFLYHASASRTFRHADVAAMYGLFFATSVLCVGSWHYRLADVLERRVMELSIITVIVGVCAAVGRNHVIIGVKPFSLTVATTVASTIMILSLGVPVFRRESLRTTLLAGAAVVVFAVAVVCQIGDRPGGWLCAPDSIVQGHALWHILSAAAVFLTVLTLEKNPTGPHMVT